MKKLITSKIGIAVLASFALATVASVTWATIPDATGVIHGCYQANSGNLRVIDSPSQGCRAHETSIDWNTGGVTNTVVRFVDQTTASGVNDSATARCAPGEKATGGGVQLRDGSIAQTFFFEPGGVPNVEAGTPTGWHASWFQNSGDDETVRVYTICAS